MVQVRTFNETVIDKEILVTSCLLCRFRFSNKTIDVHVIGIFFYRYQFGIIIITE